MEVSVYKIVYSGRDFSFVGVILADHLQGDLQTKFFHEPDYDLFGNGSSSILEFKVDSSVSVALAALIEYLLDFHASLRVLVIPNCKSLITIATLGHIHGGKQILKGILASQGINHYGLFSVG